MLPWYIAILFAYTKLEGDDFMKKCKMPNTEMQEYFDGLNKLVQESIMQSGVKFTSLEELRSFVENLRK